MRVSPPIAVVVIMSALVAGTAWLKPPQRDNSHVEVMLPMVTYQALALRGKEDAGPDGRALSVVQVIEKFAIASEKSQDPEGDQK